MVTLEPAVIVPREQGNAVVHAPELDWNVVPAGVTSVTLTPVASDGPALDTTIVYTTF